MTLGQTHRCSATPSRCYKACILMVLEACWLKIFLILSQVFSLAHATFDSNFLQSEYHQLLCPHSTITKQLQIVPVSVSNNPTTGACLSVLQYSKQLL
uniref:Uncharacterized protein n=1 Tax=Arion vulgaris TaxID=1028688 RepID=A0A0B7ALT3_9EUPU